MPAPIKPLSAEPPKPEKLYYIDNIRVILTVLVILHHACITYGASGGWYYKEATLRMGALIPLTIFVSLNQSFFMGFFFLLAAYFTYSSYQRKGTGPFITDRLVRLGTPLIFYSFIFSPFLSFLVYKFGKGHNISYWQYLHVFDDWIDFGVLWFVVALLLFTLIYVFCQKRLNNWAPKPISVPSPATTMFMAMGIGILSFLVRIVFPVGWVLKPLGFQLGHFTQYIALFTAGLLAAKNNWMEQLSYSTGKRMLSVALVLFLFFPVFYFVRTKFNLPVTWYSGGLNWLSLLYALWEQCIGLSIIIAFLGIGKQQWNKTSPVLGFLSRRAFAVYIFHPLALIILALAFHNWTADPAVKLLLIAPLGVIFSLLLGAVILLIPTVKRIV